MREIPLTKSQSDIMNEFYSVPETAVIYNKKERKALWKKAIARSKDLDMDNIKHKCPALHHQILRSYESGNNIQSAVFSECVYAQTFANMINFSRFVNCSTEMGFIPEPVEILLDSYKLVPRYVYSTDDKRRMLIQAGSCNGIDSALITVIGLVIYTIEFKEPGAKTSEPDLPKYKEDGLLLITDKWINKYPQFKQMLSEKKGINFFDIMGRNVNNFTKESIEFAVSNNYFTEKKYADVICTEDSNGILVMIPTNQACLWAKIEGEIRPAGRNDYKVWTPIALKRFLEILDAKIEGDYVEIEKKVLGERRQRGGNGRLSGYKITSLFFVRYEKCKEKNGILSFDINDVRQLNPTITAKVFFDKLYHANVKTHYYK